MILYTLYYTNPHLKYSDSLQKAPLSSSWTEKYCSSWVGTATVTSSRSDTERERRNRLVFPVSAASFRPVLCNESVKF